MGRLDEAREILKEILYRDPENIIARTNLAAVSRDMGRLDEAELLLFEAIELQKIKSKHPNPSIAKLYNNLAAVMIDKRDYYKATELLEHALQIYNHSNSGSPAKFNLLANLATLFFLMGKTKQAIDYIKKAEKGALKVLPIDHPIVKNILSIHADIDKKHSH